MANHHLPVDPVRKIAREVLARQVRKSRMATEMTQETLAGKCGIFRTYLSRIEGGSANPSLFVLATLAHELNVTLSELFQD